MKTILKFLITTLFFNFSVYSWDFTITYPKTDPCWPSIIVYDGNPANVNVNFDFSGDPSGLQSKVQILIGGQITFETQYSSVSSGTNTRSLPTYAFCYNENAIVRVLIGSTAKDSYARVYSNYQSQYCPGGYGKQATVDNRIKTELNPNNWVNHDFYRGNPCGLYGGHYQVKRWKVEWYKSGNFGNSSILINKDLSYGFSLANGNDQYRWAAVDQVTSNSAHFFTYVYRIQGASQDFWWPCSPDEACIVYSLQDNPAPIISEIRQNPQIITPGTYGTITPILSQGNCCGLYFNWTWANVPSYVTVQNMGSYLKITNNYSPQFGSEIDAAIFEVNVQAVNSNGYTPWKQFKPMLSTTNGGCPWLIVQNEEGDFEADNNLLHRSELPENEGIDIKDMYKLRITPYVDDNNCIKLKIVESDKKYNYFDQVKLYYVDYPIGSKLGITESNQVIVYDSLPVLSTDSATLNGEMITDYIQYHSDGRSTAPVFGDTLDNIFTRFPTNSYQNGAIITELESDRIRYPVLNKDYVGYLNAYTSEGNKYFNFSRREAKSEVIIPLPNLFNLYQTIYNVNLDFYRDFRVKYIALTELNYSYTPVNINLISAIHSNGQDVTSLLNDIDEMYSELDSIQYIDLTFSLNNALPLAKTTRRGYIFEINGRYITSPTQNLSQSNQNATQDKIENRQSYGYKLYNNYPNPFNPLTNIKFEIFDRGFVTLDVYDIVGRKVSQLVNGYLETGNHSLLFDGTDLPSGVYFYVLRYNDYESSKKMVLIK